MMKFEPNAWPPDPELTWSRRTPVTKSQVSFTLMNLLSAGP